MITLYVDGFPTTLGTLFSPFPTATPEADNLVGARQLASGRTNHLRAAVDDVVIYGRALDEAEIEAHRLISEAPAPTVLLAPPSPEGEDSDSDGIVDSVDNCAQAANDDQDDSDGDGVGDACQVEPDSDEDETPDEIDNCPEASNALQEDEDGIGDACEPE